jgi:glycosyltransferase involved in cell wall biosynthesis
MKILVLADNFPPERNAAAARVYERALYWVRWGHEVTVVTSFPNFPEGKLFPGYENRLRAVEAMDGIRVVRVKTFIAPNTGFAKRTLDFLSYMVTGSIAGMFEEADVVLATSPQFFAGVAGAITAAATRRPFVFEIADLWPASITAVGAMKPSLPIRALERVELALYRRARAVISLTPAFKEDLERRGVDPAKVHVAINGVDLERYAKREPDDRLLDELGLRGKFVIGYIGTLGMAHALDRVLDAAQLVRDQPRIHFLFVGPGAARESLIAEAARRGLTNVTFVPSQPKDQIARYWSVCSVALVSLKGDPTFSTVIPSKIFEAMGMGLPILLAAPKGEASAIIEREHAGIVVAPEAPSAFADAVRMLAEHRTIVAEFASASERSANSYTRETQARRVLEILDRARRS